MLGTLNARLACLALVVLLVMWLASTIGLAATPPQLPRVYVDTSEVVPTGRTIAVAAGESLQSALDTAQPGDVITLQAGAVFRGPFTLPAKSGNGWIIVRTSAPDSSLPAPGNRITPASAASLPKIISANVEPALLTAAGAHHFRFVGIEFTLASGVPMNYELVRLGDATQTLAQVPHDLIFDRVYVHGNATADLRRCFTLNSGSTGIVNSYVADCHQVGFEAQAIGGWNGPGPYKIANNYLEGAGENIIFGGGDPSIPNLVPSDIEIRGNHFYKPKRWKVGDPTYGGKEWTVKNLLELKNAQRVLIVGNVFEHNWPHAQNGYAILFTVRNQDGTAPWSRVGDITFTHNIVRNVAAVFNIHNTDNNQPSQPTQRILIQHNILYNIGTADWGGPGIFLQTNGGPSDVEVNHNTALQTSHITAAGGDPAPNFVFTNNITLHNQYGFGGDGTYGNPRLTISTYFPGSVISGNVIIGGAAADYPTGNHFPSTVAAVGFTNPAAGDYRLLSSSPYKHAAPDGTDLGANVDAVNVATITALSGGSSSAPAPSAPANLRIIRQ